MPSWTLPWGQQLSDECAGISLVDAILELKPSCAGSTLENEQQVTEFKKEYEMRGRRIQESI
jgi:hypothetical protein